MAHNKIASNILIYICYWLHSLLLVLHLVLLHGFAALYLNNTIYAFLACSFCPIGLPAAIADLKNLEVLNFFNNHIEVSTMLVFILLECIC